MYDSRCAMPEKDLDFPVGLDSKESTCNMGDLGSISGLGRSPGGEHGNPLTPVFLPEESPWTEEPDGLQSMGSQRFGHDCTIDTLALTLLQVSPLGLPHSGASP